MYAKQVNFSFAGANNMIMDDYSSDYIGDKFSYYCFLHSLLKMNNKSEIMEKHRNYGSNSIRKILNELDNVVECDPDPEKLKKDIQKIINFLDNKKLKFPKIGLAEFEAEKANPKNLKANLSEFKKALEKIKADNPLPAYYYVSESPGPVLNIGEHKGSNNFKKPKHANS